MENKLILWNYKGKNSKVASSNVVPGLLEKYQPSGGKKKRRKKVYLERWKANHPQNRNPQTSPSSAVIVGNIPRRPLSEWCLARLLLQS